MKTILKIAVIAISLVFLLIADISILSVPLVPEADAIICSSAAPGLIFRCGSLKAVSRCRTSMWSPTQEPLRG